MLLYWYTLFVKDTSTVTTRGQDVGACRPYKQKLCAESNTRHQMDTNSKIGALFDQMLSIAPSTCL
jgi:hypothetical protein